MKILRFAFGLVGAMAFAGLLFGFADSLWVVLVAAAGLAIASPDEEDFHPTHVPSVGPRTHDVED